MRLIDADALKAKLQISPHNRGLEGYAAGYHDARCVDIDAIDCAPTIDPEVRHGHWIFHDMMTLYVWKCSECKGNSEQRFAYCPYCGARMDGDENAAD